jgi:uncharacterized membrane protein YjjP (DUF1212 family)
VSPERPLRNPFRSEADAFRLLLIAGVAVAAIVVAAAVGGPWLGVPVAVIVIAAGARASYRWIRQSIQPPNEDRAATPGERASEREPEGSSSA